MEKCVICGKEMLVITHTHLKLHNMILDKYLAQFPLTKTTWNQGLTKYVDSRLKGGLKRGQNIRHKPTFSRETLGDRYDEINSKRREKISQNANLAAISRNNLKEALVS